MNGKGLGRTPLAHEMRSRILSADICTLRSNVANKSCCEGGGSEGEGKEKEKKARLYLSFQEWPIFNVERNVTSVNGVSDRCKGVSIFGENFKVNERYGSINRVG